MLNEHETGECPSVRCDGCRCRQCGKLFTDAREIPLWIGGNRVCQLPARCATAETKLLRSIQRRFNALPRHLIDEAVAATQ